VNVAAGTYPLTAKAYDNLNANTVSTVVNITVNNGNKAPLVTLTNPLDNTSYITGTTVSLAANASDQDGTIARVEFFNGSNKLGEDSSSPYSFSWAPSEGTYYISAKAIDNSGASTFSSTALITVRSSPFKKRISSTWAGSL
jgi:chitodextrinase